MNYQHPGVGQEQTVQGGYLPTFLPTQYTMQVPKANLAGLFLVPPLAALGPVAPPSAPPPAAWLHPRSGQAAESRAYRFRAPSVTGTAFLRAALGSLRAAWGRSPWPFRGRGGLAVQGVL